MAFTDEEIAEFDSVVAAALQRTEEPSGEQEPTPAPTEAASEPEVDEAAFWSQLSEQYNLEPVASAVPRTLSQEASVGFKRGIDQTQGLLYGFTGLLGQALGLESIEKYGIENYMRKMEEAAQNQATIQDPTEEIEGVGDILTYATGVLSEQIPQLLISIGGGGVGGLIGKTVAKRIITNEIAKRTLAGMTKKEAADEVAKLVAQNALTAASAAPTRGAIGGAYLANFGQISGGSFGQIAQETGEGNALAAAGFALPGAALDTAGEIFVAGKFLKPFTKTGRAAMEGVETAAGVSLPARVARNVAIGTPTGAAVEGVVEYGQTATEQMALGAADPNRTIGEVLSTPEAERERRIAAIAGATVGGPLSGAGSVIESLAPQTANALRQKTQQPQGEQAPAEPTLMGEWSQPIQVDDLRMQRSSTGLWAVVNPDREIVRGAPTIQDESGATLQIVVPDADEEGRAAMLVAKAEKALSDLSEGELTTELPAQQEEVVEEDELGEPAELDEETEATRLRQSPIGAQALREQLAEEEEVSAALADPTPEPTTEDPASEIKPAAESAAVIDEALSEEEALRRSEEGAFLLRDQMLRQEYAAGALQPGNLLGESLERVRAARVGGDQEKIALQNLYNQRRKELETARAEEEKQKQENLARPLTQAVAFVDGLELNQKVGLIGYEGRAGRFMGRRKNGNAVFRIGTDPVSGGDFIGEVTQLELKPSQFNRITLAPPPQTTKTPLEQAFADALGPNPTKQQAERVLGSPYTGTRGAQQSTFNDGLGAEAFPIEVSWFNKKGEKGTIIPSIRGKFTNSPFNTVRQMNQGLEVIVPDDQLATLNKDIEVQAVSDKKGGRKNIVTGVNLWGRTYRRGLNSPKNFSVDIPLTSKGATSRRRGLLLFDNIYKNSPERIARSEAAVRGREERQTPPEEQLKEWELVQAGLNPVEYTFYEDALARVTDFISRSNLPENVKDEARFEAQNDVVKTFANRKKRRGKQPAGDTADLSKIYLETLAGLRQKRLQDARQRATRLIGNIERNPERMSDVEIARADDADPLRGPVLGSVAGQRAAEIEERTLNEAEKSNAVDLDRAVQATLKRLAELRPDRTTKQVFNDRAAVRAIAETYKNLGKFNPVYTAIRAVRKADRSIRRREMNQQTELITDREARERAGRQRAEEPATTQEFAQGELARAEQAETVQSADRAVFPEQAEPEANEDAVVVSQPDEPLSEDFEAARERFYNLDDADRDLIFKFERQILDERGRPVRGQKSNLTQAQKRRAKLIRRYIKEGGAELENQINEGRPRTNRGSAVPADANISGRSPVGRELSGANRSLARGTAATAAQGRPESVGGPDRGGAGTATGAGVRSDGGLGVRASLAPQTVRQLSRRAKRIFVESFGRLTDAESATLTDAEIDRAYQSIVTRSNPAEVKAGKVVFGETPNSFADLAGLSASELLAGANAARRSAEEVRAVRENVGELLRARAFADVGTFLDTVQQGRFSQDMKLRAREFAKLVRRGVDLNGVGVQIARFGGDTSWAGLFTRDGNNAYDIALNLDSRHDRESAVNTFLHELSHVTTSKKVRGEIRLNRVEQDALKRLEALRREALVAAARNLGLDVPATLTDADYERLARDLDNRTLPQNDPEGQNRAYAGLTNLEEFTTEVSSSPELADLMVRLGFGQAKGRVSLLNAVRDAWNALVELITGVKADPNSPLAKAFKDSWIINFSNAGGDTNLGEYTMPEVRRSAINMEIELLNEAENFINREIEARNLEGTTEQRRAIAERFARRSPAASAKRVRDAARSMTEPQFVQWANDNGFNFTDPIAVYQSLREPAVQGSGDTVQVAESRAAGGALNFTELTSLKKADFDYAGDINGSAATISVGGFDVQIYYNPSDGFFPIIRGFRGEGEDYELATYKTLQQAKSAIRNAFTEQASGDTVQVAESRAVGRRPDRIEFTFRTTLDLERVLSGENRGSLKGLTPTRDGTLPWQNLAAKIRKAYSKNEADMVLPVLETLAKDGRINAKQAVDALRVYAGSSARVTVLNAGRATAEKQRYAELGHRLDTLAPGWRAKEAVGDLSWVKDGPINDTFQEWLGYNDDGTIPWRDEEESATARFTSVNPKPLEQMPDAGDILVEKPYESEERFGDMDSDLDKSIEFEEGVHFPTRKNVIGFGRKYTETLPNGEKATFVFEVQSDWASRIAKQNNKQKEIAKRFSVRQNRNGLFTVYESGVAKLRQHPTASEARKEMEELIRSEAAYDQYGDAANTPLLSVYESLVLKAAIQDALSKGQTKLVVTDAETAMMTEGHDRDLPDYPIIYPETVYDRTQRKQVPTGRWAVQAGYEFPNARRFEDPDEADENMAWLGSYATEREAKQAFEVAAAKFNLRKPKQFGGMTAAYDPNAGRLHAIMRKLTRNRGQRVDLGIHQNARRIGNAQRTDWGLWNRQTNQFEDAFPTEAEARAALLEDPNLDLAVIPPGELGQVTGSPVFRNPDGTPKTNVTGIAYDISNVATDPEARSEVFFSRARGRVWRPVTRRTPTGGTVNQGGMFAVDELLDKRAGDLYRESRMAIKADVAVIQELSRLLERQMKQFFKGETPPLEIINTALGNLENPLTDQQLTEIEQMRANGQTNAAAKKRDQYIRENRRNFKATKQPEALAQLPEELAATIREMSAHIESLSRQLPNEGLVNGDLAITVDEALGTYLNRSYAIFDDPQWADRVRKDAKVMDAARKFIRNSLVKDKTNELIATAAEEGRTLSRIDAEAMANDSVTENDIENMLESYLAVGQEAPTIEVLSGRIPGQKNLSLFYKRGNIAPEIQALWGRYEDPTVNYAKTVMKLSSVIANDNFLKELRDLGIQEGWLWSRENNPDDTRHPPGYVRISTENNPTLAPLGGMYAHPMLAEGLFKMFPVGGAEEHYWWLRSAMKLTGISMATKTVGSVASQIRNYLGNYLNLVATGNLGLRDIASGDFARRFQNSTDTILANTFSKYRNMSRAEWRAKIDDYIRRGIVGESITTGLLEDLLTASRKAGSPDFGDVVWNKVSEPFKRVADVAVRTYSAGDDWFKVMIYEAEQDKYRQAYPDWDDNKVKEKAAEIARDIHWTYSLAPAIVQDLKKFPFIAPFVTFTSEVIRTTYNLMKLARQEITEGRATGNKELEAIGWKRVRGMTTAAFLPLAVGSASMAMAGISGEDEEDLRRFLPDWQKNSQLLLFRKANGEVDFVDVSFLDPYEYFKKPLTAFMRSLRNADSADDILLKGTMDMVRQALDPFTSEQIFAGAIMDVMRNRDAAGRQVYNPQDTGANIGLSVGRKIFYDPFVPGTVTSFERIGKAAFGIESETGRAYNLFNELSSVALGQRVSSVDAQQALQFKSSRFMREMRDASALFNREFTSQGTRSAGDVIDGYERSNAARRSLIDSIRKDYLAAIRLGVPVQRAKAILRDGGLGRDTLKMVTTGIYKPYDASEQSLDLVRARGKNDRISAYNQARRSAVPREILAD